VKTWDVVIIGGGIIGVSLALNLRKHGASVLVVDKSEPGREASHAAAGMLAHCEQSDALRDLACASANLYPEFVHEIEDESGLKVDYRTDGTILLIATLEDEPPTCDDAVHLTAPELVEMEPGLAPGFETAIFLPEACVDPRALIAAALKAARHRRIDIASASEVTAVELTDLGATAVLTNKTRYPAGAIVNCAGAWASQIPVQGAGAQLPGALSLRSKGGFPPTRPIKGHILDVIPSSHLHAQGAPSLRSKGGSLPSPLLRHVIRTPDVYLVPRTDGRIVIGSTLEEAGFDKRVNPDTIKALFHAAANICPELAKAMLHESWTGLRPGSPDNLPILGATETPGYYVATGHFRDGILLAPITAQVMTQIIHGQQPDVDLSAFSPIRFN
jgi:glycine oxidase